MFNTSVLFCGVLLVINMALAQDQMAAFESVSKGTANFAVDLYNILKNEPGNLIFSPLSLQIVLALAYSGAKGLTATEISRALNLPEKLDDMLEGYSTLLKVLEDPSLSVANKIFIEESFQVLPNFKKSAEQHFKAGADPVTFISDSEKARNVINKWVEVKTNNKIQDLLAPGIITALTKLILVNAVHFKADWAFKFEEANTKKEKFHISKTESVDTDTMHMTKKLDYMYDAELKVKVLKLNYANSELAMLILLPDKIDGLTDLESKLSSINISERFKYFSQPKVVVQLPKFKIEKTMPLNEVLKKMGMKTMFSPNADFSGISSETELVVSDVIQKAFIDVNEKGTEAAAATGAMVRCNRACQPHEDIIQFIADHSFIFMILSNQKAWLPVFLGRYTSPVR